MLVSPFRAMNCAHSNIRRFLPAWMDVQFKQPSLRARKPFRCSYSAPSNSRRCQIHLWGPAPLCSPCPAKSTLSGCLPPSSFQVEHLKQLEKNRGPCFIRLNSTNSPQQRRIKQLTTITKLEPDRIDELDLAVALLAESVLVFIFNLILCSCATRSVDLAATSLAIKMEKVESRVPMKNCACESRCHSARQQRLACA